MRNKVLKTIKRLYKFTVDDLSIITGINETEIENILREFIDKGTVKITADGAFLYEEVFKKVSVTQKKKDFDYFKNKENNIEEYLQVSPWARKRFYKYMEIIEKTEGLKGKPLYEFIEDWNSNNSEKISYSAIQKMRTRFKNYGPIGLVPRTGKYIQVDIKEEWFERFADLYLSRAKLSKSECRTLLINEIMSETPDFDPLSFPSESSFDRKIKTKFSKEEIQLFRSKPFEEIKKQNSKARQYPFKAAGIKRLLVTAKQNYPIFYPILVMAITTGLSRSEILNLSWDNIDFENNIIFINVNRKIKVSRKIIEFLKDWKKKCEPVNSKFVFSNSKGNRHDPNHIIKRYFLPLIKKARVPKIMFSELTDIYASFMLGQNVPITFLKEQLGDKTLDLTYSKYGHLIPQFSIEKVNYDLIFG